MAGCRDSVIVEGKFKAPLLSSGTRQSRDRELIEATRPKLAKLSMEERCIEVRQREFFWAHVCQESSSSSDAGYSRGGERPHPHFPTRGEAFAAVESVARGNNANSHCDLDGLVFARVKRDGRFISAATSCYFFGAEPAAGTVRIPRHFCFRQLERPGRLTDCHSTIPTSLDGERVGSSLSLSLSLALSLSFS